MGIPELVQDGTSGLLFTGRGDAIVVALGRSRSGRRSASGWPNARRGGARLERVETVGGALDTREERRGGRVSVISEQFEIGACAERLDSTLAQWLDHGRLPRQKLTSASAASPGRERAASGCCTNRHRGRKARTCETLSRTTVRVP